MLAETSEALHAAITEATKGFSPMKAYTALCKAGWVKDVELRNSAAGNVWCRLSVGIDEGDAVTWVSVSAFEEKALALAGMPKGVEVYVEGRLSLNAWTGKDGQPRTGLSVAAWRVEVLGRIGKTGRRSMLRNSMMRSRSETEGWLCDTLKDGDTMDGKRLKGLASDSGIKERTLYRAAQAIGVTMLPGGFGKPRRWHLCPMSAKGCHVCRHVEPGAVAKAENKLRARNQAKLVTHPGVNAALVIKEFAEVFGGLDAVEVAALAAHLKDGMSDISNNDLRQCEAMLYCQAHVLQAVFVDSLLQVPKQGWFSTSEAYMRIGLKAQNQFRMTVETLAQIKNPSVVFARQANIAQGPQQVNNGMIPAGEPRAGAGGNRKCAKQTIRGQQ